MSQAKNLDTNASRKSSYNGPTLRVLEIKSKLFLFPIDTIIAIHEIRINRPVKHTKVFLSWYTPMGENCRFTLFPAPHLGFSILRKMNYEKFYPSKQVHTFLRQIEIKGFKKGDVITVLFTNHAVAI